MTNSALCFIGGTGGLGSQVAKGLITAKGYDSFKALVRDASKGEALKKMGWTLIEVADFKDAAVLEAVLKGAKRVVSTMSGSDMVTIETVAIQAAKKVGASLYVPSQFGVDYRRWGTSFPFLAGKKAALDAAEAAAMPTLCVFTGLFSDWIFDFYAEPAKGKGSMVGDGSAKVSWTRRSDIGYVLAKALEDPELSTKGGTLSMEGDNMSIKEAYDILGKVFGKELEIEKVDPEAAAKLEKDLLQKGLRGDIGAFFGSFKLHLLGEPERGNDGCNMSAEAKSYGVKLATLEEVLTEVYGSK